MRVLIEIIGCLVVAYFLAWGSCILVDALKLTSLEWLCGHNALILIFGFFVFLLVAWIVVRVQMQDGQN